MMVAALASPAGAQDVACDTCALYPSRTAGEEPGDEAVAEGEDAEEADDGEQEDPDEPSDSAEATGEQAGPGGPRYSTDISDDELKRRWRDDLPSLGSMSVGFTDSGRLINGVQFPKDGPWFVVAPNEAWGTKETVDFMAAAITQVCEQFPGTPPIRINHISHKDGGWMRPHKSHQSGRDVDVGFYYPTADPVRIRNRDKVIDVPRNWALIKALAINADVQVILVDKKIQAVLYAHALAQGEDPAWLHSIFKAGRGALVQHARGHRDHFHVRFYGGRSQELGRRILPMLAERPEHNVMTHKVRRGETLGHIARKYGTSVKAIQTSNRLGKRTFLKLGQALQIPLRKPCTKCPVPPDVVIPPRRLPPDASVASVRDAAPPAPPGDAPAEPEATTVATEGDGAGTL